MFYDCYAIITRGRGPLDPPLTTTLRWWKSGFSRRCRGHKPLSLGQNLLFGKSFAEKFMKTTRLHSSRMRIARALTVSPSMLCGGRKCTWSRGMYLVLGGYLVPGVYLVQGVYLVPGGVPGPGGGVPGLGGVPGPSEVYLVWGGVPGPGGCAWSQGGVPGPGGVPGQVLPPVDRHTPVKLLPCPKLRLRAVTMHSSRMRTVRLLTVYRSIRGWWGDVSA